MFVQIAVASDLADGNTLYALSNDGKIYELKTKRVPAEQSPSGKPFYTSWWHEINISFTEPYYPKKPT